MLLLLGFHLIMQQVVDFLTKLAISCYPKHADPDPLVVLFFTHKHNLIEFKFHLVQQLTVYNERKKLFWEDNVLKCF